VIKTLRSTLRRLFLSARQEDCRQAEKTASLRKSYRCGTFSHMRQMAGNKQHAELDYAAIERQFWPHGGDRDVWMILDPARDRRIHFDLVNSHMEYACLYSGNIADELEAVAPHLVQLEFDDKYTRDLITRSWGQSWGVFLRCPARMERLRRHLRTLLLVNDWTGRRLLFRYYDPRVLRVYLPTCATEELSTIFGPVTHFWTEEASAQQLLEFALNRGKLLRSDIFVKAVEPAPQS
jgi:hypothetical protein